MEALAEHFKGRVGKQFPLSNGQVVIAMGKGLYLQQLLEDY